MKPRIDHTSKKDSFSSRWVQVDEWDSIAEKPVTLTFNAADFERRKEDAEAALRIAESVQEQQPELLEVVAKYMEVADELGSEEARAWLLDYYEVDDQRYHPYV